ncbi:MAG: hypothetical protein LBE36_03525 [Flavobacteriaceae bacterium]|nr:hypothetical protein [Flavobacteriaceae bacterium]
MINGKKRNKSFFQPQPHVAVFLFSFLQNKSTGLPIEQPLPIFPENDPENCENPLELEGETSFTLDDANLQRSEETSSTLD